MTFLVIVFLFTPKSFLMTYLECLRKLCLFIRPKLTDDLLSRVMTPFGLLRISFYVYIPVFVSS